MFIDERSPTIYIYSDASFSKFYGIAFIGYAIFQSSAEHETVPLSEDNVQVLQVQENNNIRAEIRGVITAMQACSKGANVVVYTDCKSICDLPGRRKKLELNNFVSKSKDMTLSNADIYREFYINYDRLNVELKWIKGHSSNSHTLTQVQKNFSRLDIEVRKNLRRVLSNASQVT